LWLDNLSWRGVYIQNNNAMLIEGAGAVALFRAAFDNTSTSSPPSADAIRGSDADRHSRHRRASCFFTAFRGQRDARQRRARHAKRQFLLLYSLAFLYQTDGPVREAVKKVTENNDIFVYGISDKHVGAST